MNEYIVQDMQDTKRSGWKLPTIIGVVAALAGGFVGAGVVATTGTTPADNGACVVALDHADEAMDLYRGAFGDASEAINAYLANDYAGMDRSTANINQASNDVDAVLIDYNLAHTECLDNSKG